MESSNSILSIAVLNCGYTSPIIQNARGQYSDIFASLLKPALDRANHGQNISKSQRCIQGWDVVSEEYPPTLNGIDAIIVSGSPNSSYQDLPWIKKLDRYLFCIRPIYSTIQNHASADCVQMSIIVTRLSSYTDLASVTRSFANDSSVTEEPSWKRVSRN